MTIDEKIEHYSWSFSGQSSDQVITVMMAKQIIHQALKKQREGALAEDESFSLAQYEHMVNGADLKEDMSLIDLARDSFAHGYFYAIKRLLNAPEPEL